MKIAILNSVALNGGDAAIVFGTCDAIRERIPDASLSVFCHSAAHVQGYYPELAIRRWLQDEWPGPGIREKILRKSFPFRDSLGLLGRGERAFFRAVKDTDAALYIGGGYLSDNYGTANLLRVMRRTAASGVPHMVYAQSFGPFHRENTIEGLKYSLGLFRAVTTRDQASLDLLKSIGISGPTFSLTADAAFSMRPFAAEEMPAPDRKAADEIVRFKERGGGDKMVFLSVREWGFPGRSDSAGLRERSQAELRAFLLKVLSETDWKVCFLSTCQGRPSYNFDDSQVANDLTKDLCGHFPDRIFISSHPFHPRSYPSVLERCADLVVTVRMHMAILSILAGVPFIAIAYEQKSKELARQVGVEDCCFDLATFDAHSLFRAFVRSVGMNEGLRMLLKKALPEVRNRSLKNAEILGGIIGS